MARGMGINQSSLRDVVGVKKSAPSFDMIQKIVDNPTFQINADWLITGDGAMLKSDPPQPNAVLPFQLKDAIPYYADLPVSAGEQALAEVVSTETPTGYMLIPGVSAKGIFPVVGCSMLPLIKAGDYIGINEINRWDLVDPAKIYMIITHEERMIKRLRTDSEDDEILWCVSENYKDFKILKVDIKAIYHVVYHGELL
ncbi:MAG: S24 family peptidase [Prevotella sp.]|nr:S24 family peptidase [Prevotella sp.]